MEFRPFRIQCCRFFPELPNLYIPPLASTSIPLPPLRPSASPPLRALPDSPVRTRDQGPPMQVATTQTHSIASLMASPTCIPQKRKEPPPSSLAQPREQDRILPKTEPVTDREIKRSPSEPKDDEYASGRIVCESCNESIPIRDDATGQFTVKHWDAHRNACQNASQTTTEILAEAPAAQPDTPTPPQPKRRRAKRTEEERIDYLRSDPYVAKFEAYRVLCASCDKWIRLRPNSTYCSIPWDAHRKSCLAKRVGKNAHPPNERSAAFTSDPTVKRYDNSRVQCRNCERWIPLLADDTATAVKTWKEHRESCPTPPAESPTSSTSKFNIANVPPPPKHLLALASSSSLPPPPFTSARPAPAQSASSSQPPPRLPPLTTSVSYVGPAFKDYNPNNFPATQESRRRNADQRAAALRADPCLGDVEPSRVFCKLCRKWVQLRQDSTFCAYPWMQHKAKCLKRHQKMSDRDAEIAELRASRDAALQGELEASDSTGTADVDELEDDDDDDRPDRDGRTAERRHAKVMEKAEAATVRLQQLEDPRAGTPASSGDDDGEGEDYMDVDTAPVPAARLADLNSPAGRLEFVSRSIRHLFRATYARSDELTIAALVTYLNAAMPPDKHEDYETAEVTKAMTALHERGAFVFEGDVIRTPDA
ncbi:hypothetical protein C8Q80DRAFT_132696 [Daedaleopsis nitida]|nr:hypothetical protein C8Q80DRAFT_132696 [Daedaleopsis nitida]